MGFFPQLDPLVDERQSSRLNLHVMMLKKTQIDNCWLSGLQQKNDTITFYHAWGTHVNILIEINALVP